MDGLAIRARFPLGTFLGHRDVGKASPYPDTARLMSALAQAAGKGSTAINVKGDLRPSPASAEALAWLEAHPPSALQIPPSRFAAEQATVSWRVEGVLEKAGGGYQDRKLLKHQSAGVALAGAVGWAWDESVPDHVADALTALCADVSCLGESDSPVVLEIGDVTPTHLRDSTQTRFPSPGGLRVPTPQPGRFAELESDYEAARPAKPPTLPRDRHSFTEGPRPSGLSRSRVRDIVYRPVEPGYPDLPWNDGIALPTGSRLPWDERVRCAVTFHRALVSRLGDDAPPLVTGNYPDGLPRPANRIAIHYVCGPTAQPELRDGALLVLLPRDAAPEERETIRRAVAGIRRVLRGQLPELTLGSGMDIDPERFWLPPLPGMARRWQPVPAAMPETRSPRSAPSWSLADAAYLSIGHVFRDRLDLGRLRGDERYIESVRQVRAWGVDVSQARRIADSRIERFAHKLPTHLVAQPYSATISLGPLVAETAVLAIGQARHLGGGLLVPADRTDEGVRL